MLLVADSGYEIIFNPHESVKYLLKIVKNRFKHSSMISIFRGVGFEPETPRGSVINLYF